MRPVVTVAGDASDLAILAHGVNFALSGKRHHDIHEVWLDAADDAGDIWTIERGAKGAVFRRNGRSLSIEEAQRSLLASLLDLDASLNQVEGLVATVEMRQIITRGSEVAATKWDMSGCDTRSDVSSLVAAKEIAGQVAKINNSHLFADPMKLCRLAGPASRILGAYEELTHQAEQLKGPSAQSPLLDPNLEAIQTELDVLNQIDQLIRRINEGGESSGRLNSLFESFDRRMAEIENKWGKETLAALSKVEEMEPLIDLRVKLAAWSRFVDNLSRVKLLVDEQIRPTAVDGVKVWDEFLTGTRSTGQEIESCLASMLLGLKQLSHEVDRYVSQPSGSEPQPPSKTSNWFDRLKSGSTKVVDDRFKEASPVLQHQKEWIVRLAREVEAVKVATEYALQSTQGLTDRVANAREKIQREASNLSTLLQKAAGEHEKLRDEWQALVSTLGFDPGISLEDLVGLIADATEYLIILDSRQDLAVRVEDRRTIQKSLEVQVRKWWEIIGSQKTTDLSNTSFLIVEAKGALRYREGRRQRIQKGLEETAKIMSSHAINFWVLARQTELSREWSKLFSIAELPTPPIDSSLARETCDGALRCAALLDISRVEEHERFAAASLWPSRLDSVVVIYRWSDQHVPPAQRTYFLKSLSTFTGGAGVPVFLLLNDVELVGMIVKAGTGSASVIELEDVEQISGPRIEGGVAKAEAKPRRAPNPTQKPTSPSPPIQVSTSQKSLLSPKAEAALRVLNPKGSK